MNKKKNIAIIWGGYTSEIVISDKSKESLYNFIDKDKFNVYKVKVDRDAWTVETKNGIVTINKNDFSFIEPIMGLKVNFDFAYITIHGTPGEDGKIQGYFDLLKIPYSCCGVFAAALTMNKYACNHYLRNFDIKVSDSLKVNQKSISNLDSLVKDLGLPVFVKPNTGGSSFATTKVSSLTQLGNAVNLAFKETPEVIIEKFIEGVEVTCGCYKVEGKEVAFPLTEVVPNNEFFDYEAKYEGAVTEITPARITEELTKLIQQQTLLIYDLISAKGIIRADYIIKDQIPFLLEVNVTPGMTETSFIPQQVKVAGLDMTTVLTEIIENEFNQN